MNQDNIASSKIIIQLEAEGLRAAFLPYRAIEQIKQSYDELSENSINEEG